MPRAQSKRNRKTHAYKPTGKDTNNTIKAQNLANLISHRTRMPASMMPLKQFLLLRPVCEELIDGLNKLLHCRPLHEPGTMPRRTRGAHLEKVSAQSDWHMHMTERSGKKLAG